VLWKSPSERSKAMPQHPGRAELQTQIVRKAGRRIARQREREGEQEETFAVAYE